MHYFQCEDLDATLELVQDTLERLEFRDMINLPRRHLHFRRNEWVISPTVRGRIRSLASFTQLNRLEISLACVLGERPHDQIQLADVLPRSLQFLCLFAREACPRPRDLSWDHESIFDRISTGRIY